MRLTDALTFRLGAHIAEGGVGGLFVQGLSVVAATLEKTGPGRNRGKGIGFFGREAPKVGMMPAELMEGGIAMDANAFPQPDDLLDQPLRGHVSEIGFHFHGIMPPP